MKLIKQQNQGDCGLASLSMLLDVPTDALILELGHDGNEIIWPDLPEPIRRRGFSNQEFIDLCYSRGFALLWILARVGIIPDKNHEPFLLLNEEQECARLEQYMAGVPGLIIGEIGFGRRHMCAWNGELVYDPKGFVYDFNSSEPIITDTESEFYPIAIAEFLPLLRIKSSEGR